MIIIGGILQEFFGNPLRDPREQRADGEPHLAVAGPLPVQEFSQGVERLQAHVRDLRAGRQRSVTKQPDQILQAMRHGDIGQGRGNPALINKLLDELLG